MTRPWELKLKLEKRKKKLFLIVMTQKWKKNSSVKKTRILIEMKAIGVLKSQHMTRMKTKLTVALLKSKKNLIKTISMRI